MQSYNKKYGLEWCDLHETEKKDIGTGCFWCIMNMMKTEVSLQGSSRSMGAQISSWCNSRWYKNSIQPL